MAIVKDNASEPTGVVVGQEIKPPLDARERRIQRQGLYQAALQCYALVTLCQNVADIKRIAREIAEDGIKFVNE